MTPSIPTYLLTHWARDRDRGPRLSVEEAVRLQTSATAEVLGLEDRGTIAVGKRADLNVIDFERLHLGAPYRVNDLPAGGAVSSRTPRATSPRS
ncbi:MAG: amidohydrolase family protein [Ilumatobacteraceae bacterium]